MRRGQKVSGGVNSHPPRRREKATDLAGGAAQCWRSTRQRPHRQPRAHQRPISIHPFVCCDDCRGQSVLLARQLTNWASRLPWPPQCCEQQVGARRRGMRSLRRGMRRGNLSRPIELRRGAHERWPVRSHRISCSERPRGIRVRQGTAHLAF